MDDHRQNKFADYNGQVKLTAVKLLTPKQLTQLEGGALGILPFDVMEKAKDQLPSGVRAVFEAENNIRQLVASGNYTYADMEKYAIVAGMARQEVMCPVVSGPNIPMVIMCVTFLQVMPLPKYRFMYQKNYWPMELNWFMMLQAILLALPIPARSVWRKQMSH